MTPTVTHRRAVPGDETPLASLDLAASTRATLGADLRRDDRVGIVAEVGAAPVGLVLLGTGPDHGHVLDVAVHPDHRRRGIATAMLEHAHRVARDRGLGHVTLEYRVSNRAGRALYASLGYVEAGVKPDVFNDERDGPVEDGVIAWWPGIPDGVPRSVVPQPTPLEA